MRIKSDLLNYPIIHGESPGALVIEEERLRYLIYLYALSHINVKEKIGV